MAKYNSELKIWESTKLIYPHPMDVFFGEIMLQFCDQTPDRVIQLHHEESKTLTCYDLKKSSITIAQNLTQIGIKPDDVITMICRNSNFVTSLIHGCVLMGAVINPLSHQLSSDNIFQLLNQTRPKLIVCDLDMLESLDETKKWEYQPLIYITSEETIESVSSAFDLLKAVNDEYEFHTPKFDKKADEKLLAILC